MRHLESFRNSLSHWCVLAVAAAAWWAGGYAVAAPFPPDPVEELRQALRVSIRDPMKNPDELTYRRRSLQKWTGALRTIGEMRRALLLQEWRDTDRDVTIGEIDRTARTDLAKRFEEALRDVLKRGNTDSRLAAVNLIGDLGLSGRSINARELEAGANLAQDLVPALVERTRDDVPAVRAAAAQSLGEVFADDNLAVPALRALLGSGLVSDRRAAAEGLLKLVRVASQLTRGQGPTGGIGRDKPDYVRAGRAVAATAPQGLTDPDVVVRRHSADAFRQAASVLVDSVSESRQEFPPLGRQLTPDERQEILSFRQEVQKEQALLLPLARTLRDQAAALVGVLNDPDLTVRLLARQGFEEMGLARQKLLRRAASVPPLPKEKEAAAPPRPFGIPRRAQLVARAQEEKPALATEDPLLQGLQTALPALIAGLDDPSVRVRLATVDALEVFGDGAEKAGPALVRKLYDPSHYVRWAAARTLGRMAPVEVATAIPGLGQMLSDPDLDLDLAAASALDRYSVAARRALPSLIQALETGDVELRVAAIQTITNVGTDAQPAIPALAGALRHRDPRVRRAAAEALGRFGPLAQGASSALSRVLDDDDAEVRRLAADALLAINQKPQHETK